MPKWQALNFIKIAVYVGLQKLIDEPVANQIKKYRQGNNKLCEIGFLVLIVSFQEAENDDRQQRRRSRRFDLNGRDNGRRDGQLIYWFG